MPNAYEYISRPHLYLVALVITMLPAPFLATIDPKFAIGWTCAAFVLIATLYRWQIKQELVIAFLFALFVTSYQTYTYTSGNATIGHINLFPLVAWTAGLVALGEAYERTRLSHKLIVFSFIYWVLLFAFEYVGYYWFAIRIAADEPALFGMGIIHGTPFIHLFYLCAGPIYLIVTDYLQSPDALG
jgi:hypothetical protein